MKDTEKFQPWTAKQERFGKVFIKKIAKWQTKVYELSNGRLWSKFLGVHCAILTTIGKKTGDSVEVKTPKGERYYEVLSIAYK